ncbi:MAG: hypothetical protein RBS27_01510 [Giesbergeria sp.]|nr:hypothetical protein [Giesbergeria sp.]
MADAIIHLSVPATTKARWVRESRAAGMRLTDWIVQRVERKEKQMQTVTTYIVVTTSGRIDEDARAAADAINRSMAASGDCLNRAAVEAEVAAYTKFAGRLAVEPCEVEIDE